MRPRGGPIRRIDDAQTELDPSFPGDSEILKGGARAILWEPFRSGGTFSGGVWLCPSTPRVFTDEHQEVLHPIAALLGTAVEHWRIWDAERRRRDRVDRIEELLRTLTQSLDVAEVFPRLSEQMQPILPHHMMVLTELDVRAHAMRIVAAAGHGDSPYPTETVTLTPGEQERRVDVEIIHDLQKEIAPDTERQRLILSSGMRSWLRVPVWVSGEVRGGSASSTGNRRSSSTRTSRSRGGSPTGSRSLARCAGWPKRRASRRRRERAERLEARVETLARELESRERGRIIGVSRSWKETLRSVGRVASSETSVLITGESGTGKEVVANLIHQGSPRAGKPSSRSTARRSRAAPRIRALRTRARRLHRCHRDEDRAHRAGGRAGRSSSTRSPR